MLQYGLPVGFALFLWWASTGAILYLDGLPRRTHKWTLAGATVLMAVAFAGLLHLRNDTSVSGAYLGFAAALAIWGWNEVAFLTGYVTGSKRVACPPDCRGLARFIYGAEMILYHEIAIIIAGAAILVISNGAPNHVAASTYVILWVMRLSTKLNLFLGVPHAPAEFLPDHLRYLASCFRKGPMNLLFPISVTAGTVIATVYVTRAVAASAGSFEIAAHTFLATLMVLAIIEHWFLMIPVPTQSLWGWGMRSHEAAVAHVPIRPPADAARATTSAHPFAENKN